VVGRIGVAGLTDDGAAGGDHLGLLGPAERIGSRDDLFAEAILGGEGLGAGAVDVGGRLLGAAGDGGGAGGGLDAVKAVVSGGLFKGVRARIVE
jgi:hypothetical protein